MSRGLRYRVIRKIAHGGMAEIFLAMQVGAEGFEKPVVLKRILPALAADPGFVRMLVDEAHIASSLSHSHLVQVLDLGKADDQFFLALEFVDGFSLEQIRRRAQKARLKMPLPLTLYIVSALCRGLDYVHRRTRNGKPLGIVHRDVTPQNVLIGREGDVKLADFGIAKARGRREKSATGVIKGKFAYMSPEQSIGAPLDARSDLFSVGTLMYVLTTGKKPFDGVTDLEVLMQVRKARYEKPSALVRDFNPDVERFIARAMRAEKSRRWQSAEQMADRLDAILFKLGQPVGPAALKRWMETLTARDGVQPPGDVREDAKAPSNETIQLVSNELELQDVAPPPEDGDDDEFSVAKTLAQPWKRAAATSEPVIAHVAAQHAEATCIGTAATVVAPAPPSDRPSLTVLPFTQEEADEALGEYEFTLHSPIAGTGTTFTGPAPIEATELAVAFEDTALADDYEPAEEPAEATRNVRAPVIVERTIRVAADSAVAPTENAHLESAPAESAHMASAQAPAERARVENVHLESARVAPRVQTKTHVDPTLIMRPIPAKRLTLSIDVHAEEPSRISRPTHALRITGRVAAAFVILLATAGGGAYAARPYLPPWLVPPALVQRVDTWISAVLRTP